MVLNDQGESLVDTQLARKDGLLADEVTGGCFCCRFSMLMEAAGRLRAQAPAVIFAEPVGELPRISRTRCCARCTRFTHTATGCAPFTVCVDPARVNELELQRLPIRRYLFLFRNQLAEADLMHPLHQSRPLSLLDERPECGGECPLRRRAGRPGRLPGGWTRFYVGQLPVGAHTLDIDYGEYARAPRLRWRG